MEKAAEKGFSLVQTPNKSWRPGLSVDDPFKGSEIQSINPDDPKTNPRELYQLLIGAVTPRPIAFVSTLSGTGTKNLAPFSFFNVYGSAPPTFVIGFSSGRGTEKDSCINILETKECTINIISEWFVEAANWCSIDAPASFSEWPSCGLKERPSKIVKPPCVAESAASFECRYVAHHDMIYKAAGIKSGTVVILEGVQIHIKDGVLDNDKKNVNLGKLKPVSRLQGISYGLTTEGFDLPRIDFNSHSTQEMLCETQGD